MREVQNELEEFMPISFTMQIKKNCYKEGERGTDIVSFDCSLPRTGLIQREAFLVARS